MVSVGLAMRRQGAAGSQPGLGVLATEGQLLPAPGVLISHIA
jgi:hypothetical protein